MNWSRPRGSFSPSVDSRETASTKSQTTKKIAANQKGYSQLTVEFEVKKKKKKKETKSAGLIDKIC